jgi:AcrR family transcriptional regulator
VDPGAERLAYAARVSGTSRGSGRRPGATRTRDAILVAAQTAFAEQGYLDTTIRQVARTAGVDSALVIHFFDSKDQLFAAALRSNTPTDRLLELADDGDVADLGERLVRCYLDLWEDGPTSGRMLAVARAASASASASRMVASFMSEDVMLPLAKKIGSSDAPLRANLTGAHLFGLATARYVLRVEPLASLDRESVVPLVSPIIQHYLTGELAATSR